MKRIAFYSILLLLSVAISKSAEAKNVQIKGTVVSAEDKEPLQYATITIVDTLESVLFNGIVQREDGDFHFNKVSLNSPNLKIRVSYMGYVTYSEDINLRNYNRTVDLGEIMLKHDELMLPEFTVRRASVSDAIDKSIYMADSTLLEGVTTTVDLLKKIPELHVNLIKRTATIVGKSNTLILVNNVNTGENTDLRTIDFREVEKVEIISTPSSGVEMGYDGIINITLKSNVKQGFSFYTEGTLKIDNLRSADAYLGTKWGVGKLRFDLSYDNYYRKHRFVSNETRIDKITGDTYHTDGVAPNPREVGNTFSFKVDYNISERDLLNVTTRTNLYNVNRSIENTPTMTHDGVVQELANFTYKEKSKASYGNYTLFYRRKLAEKKNTFFSLNSNFSFMNSKYFSNSHYENGVDLPNDEHADRHTFNLLATYSNPFSEIFRLSAGVQGYYQRFKGRLDGDVNQNNLKNYRFNGFADLISTFGNYQILAGAKVERNINDFDNPAFKSVGNTIVQPQATIMRKFENKSLLRLIYRRTPRYVSSWLLTPYETKLDDKTTWRGNPNLRPSINNVVQLEYQFRKKEQFLSSFLYYSRGDKLVSTIKEYGSDLNLIQTPSNAGRGDRVGVLLNGYFLIGGFIELEPIVDLFYENYRVDGFVQHNRTFRLSADIGIDLPAGFALGAFGSYRGKKLTHFGYVKPMFELDAIYLFKSFSKINLTAIVAYQSLVEPSEREYSFRDNFIQKEYYRTKSKGVVVRLNFYFNKGREQKMETVRTYFDDDLK